MRVSRRGFLLAGLPLVGIGGLAIYLDRRFNPHTPVDYPLPAGGTSRAATPECLESDHHDTHAVTEGPFYRPGTPKRSVLRDAGTIGVPLTLRGRVFSSECTPVAEAVLDVWNCDGNGVYDNDGFRLRGHQFTDATGAFRFETVKPGGYRNFGIHRTSHIHVKVQGRDTRLLTTQLFFPHEPLNDHDWFFRDELVVHLAGDVATFDFVLSRRT